MVNESVEASKTAGLVINKEKTKYMGKKGGTGRNLYWKQEIGNRGRIYIPG